MDRLHEAMEKVLARRPTSEASPPRTTLPGTLLPRQPGEPLLAIEKISTAGWLERDLLRGRIVAQSAASRSAPANNQRAIEAFRMTRTRVLQAVERSTDAARIIAVTSPRQGEGKTLVSINLAIAIARQSQKSVLLVDADLRVPGVAKTTSIQPKAGLSDYLEGRAPLETCVLKAPEENLFVLPQVGPVPNSSELLANGSLGALTRTVRQRYSDWMVLIDCPPLLLVDDGLVLLQEADKAILVVREGKTSKSQLRRAAETIGRDKYLGTVLNDSSAYSGEEAYGYDSYG